MGVTVREKVKGSGVWWLFINQDGKRKSKKVGAEKAAREAAAKIEAKLTLREYNINDEKKQIPLFKDYSELWLESYIKPIRRPSTYERYGDVLKKHINPYLGDITIDEIKRKDIRNLLLKHHGNGLSKASIALIRDVISGPMEYAIEDEIIEANPAKSILKRLNLEREKQLNIEPMTFEEVDLFLDTCQKLYPEYRTFFLCAFRTGARLGELIALHWSDIDWNEQNIKIQRSFRRGVVNKPKNNKSRVVDMSDQLMEALKRLQTTRKKEALKAGQGDPVEIVFHRDGTYLDQKYIRRVWTRILKKAGMRYKKPHITRHTFASLLLSNGESPVYVKEQLGHHSIKMTVDIYGHLIKNSNKKAVNKLDTCKTVQEGADRVQKSEKIR